ncbi:MAG: hypothetical protein H6709_13580 [Kofleriaceae bacterium]|nr:hypothetical protein [Kofleriaceae bacterium]MCB9573109.1 hypothetical protein [Kofleriaceae bacterium]
MHAWLADHDLAAAEAAFGADVDEARGDGAPVPRIAGFQYFPYEALRDLAGPGRGDGGRAGP